MKIKLDDLAKQLNISVAAVSMALNDKKGVSDETRERVIKVAKEMGYEIKVTQKVEEEKESKKYIKLIRLKKHGLVAADTAFFAAVVEGIEEECKKNGYQMLVSNYKVEELTEAIIEEELSASVSGNIVFATELAQEDVMFLNNCKSPFVILDSFFIDQDWNTVLMNNFNATYQAVKHLLKNGHTQIGYLKSSKSIYNFDRRYSGYKDALNATGLILNEGYTMSLEPTLLGAESDMDLLLQGMSREQLPTAFVADNDIIALGGMNALKKHGYHVPADISIIGIDDMPFCEMVSPKLSTIKIFKREMGREAVRLLLSGVNKETPYTQKREINTMIIERESVRNI